MTRTQQIAFELYVMDIAENEKCKTAEDFERLSQDLHESIENAIYDLCMDYNIEDYSPSF